MERLKRILSMLLVCCMIFTSLPITAKAAKLEEGSVIQFVNYFSAGETGGVSTNDHYTVVGIGVDANGQAYVVMGSDKPFGQIKDIDWIALNPTAGDNKYVPEKDKIYLDDDPSHRHTAEESFYDERQVTIQLPNDSVVLNRGSVVGYFVIPLGDFDALMTGGDKFNLAIDCSENGWDIQSPGVEITVNLDYEITKTVDKAEAEPGDALTYTVIASNTGDYSITNVNVYDVLPEFLDKDTVSVTRNGEVWSQKQEGESGEGWYWTTDNGQSVIMLDYDIILEKSDVVNYTISANVKEDCKGGPMRNTAIIGSQTLAEKDAHAVTTVDAYFYVHHIKNDGTVGHENGVEERIDKVLFNEALGRTYYVDTNKDGKFDENDEIKVNDTLSKFDVNADGGGVNAESKIQTLEDETIGTKTFVDGTYDGLLDNTLYGGTFEADYTTLHNQFNKNHSDYKDDENGIDFTPEVNEHYYVWEPTNEYLQPINLAVWHTHGAWNPTDKYTQYHTVAGYPLTTVDREYYRQFGFVENGVVTQEEIYNIVKVQDNSDKDNPYELKAQYLGLTGYLGSYKSNEGIFNKNVIDGETFLPYWITLDGVKVTGIYQRNTTYSGEGTEESYKRFNVNDTSDTYSVEKYETPSSTPLMAKAMFYDNSLTHPLIPEIVGAAFEGITAGNSGNVKGVKLTLDLSEFKYDRVWFDVNGEMVKAQKKDGMLSAEISIKKDAELTVIPHWSYGDREFTGAAKLLNVTKKNVEDITPVAPATARRMSAASFRTTMSLNEEISGVILQQGGMN